MKFLLEWTSFYQTAVISNINSPLYFFLTLKFYFSYSRIQNILICLIARRLYMLTKENIKDGALYISTTKEEWFELMDFFHELKSDCETVTECYPVILVIDEVSDKMLIALNSIGRPVDKCLYERIPISRVKGINFFI